MKRTRIVLLTLVLLAAMLIAVPALAKTSVVKPGEDFVYLDNANVLSDATEGEIYFANKQMYEASGAMIVVVAMDNLGGADTYDYAYELYNSWKIGGKDENNGLLILLAVEEDNYYVLPGAGFEGIFSASVLKRMMDDDLEPDFAKKNYDAGARKIFESAYKKLADYYNIKLTIDDAKAAYAEFNAESAAAADFGGNEFEGYAGDNRGSAPVNAQNEDSGMLELLIVVIFIVLLVVGLRSKKRGGAFWFWRPTFFWPIFGPRTYPPNWNSRVPPVTPNPGPFVSGPRAPSAPGPRATGPSGFGGTRTGGFTGGRTVSRSSGTMTQRSPFSGSSSSRSTSSTSSSSRSFGGFTRSFGGRSGGFGGGFSGGGRTFGGGAGRGRH